MHKFMPGGVSFHPFPTGAQPEIFQDRGGFVELGYFDKLFVKNTRKKGPAGSNFGAFPPRYS